MKQRSEVLSPASVEVLYRWVATIFKAAVGDRLIAVSPFDRIARPKRPRLGPPKSAAGFRSVPLPATVTDALASHLTRHPAGPQA